MVASVKVVDNASAREIESVEAALRGVGGSSPVVRARHRTQDQPHVGEALPWIVSITLAVPIAAFFAAIGTEAGKDAYLAIKQWLVSVADISNPAVYGHVEIVDPDATRMDLRPKALSDDAFAGLLEIDWARVRGCELRWSEDHKRWMEYDEYIERVARPAAEKLLGRPLE